MQLSAYTRARTPPLRRRLPSATSAIVCGGNSRAAPSTTCPSALSETPPNGKTCIHVYRRRRRRPRPRPYTSWQGSGVVVVPLTARTADTTACKKNPHRISINRGKFSSRRPYHLATFSAWFFFVFSSISLTVRFSSGTKPIGTGRSFFFVFFQLRFSHTVSLLSHVGRRRASRLSIRAANRINMYVLVRRKTVLRAVGLADERGSSNDRKRNILVVFVIFLTLSVVGRTVGYE